MNKPIEKNIKKNTSTKKIVHRRTRSDTNEIKNSIKNNAKESKKKSLKEKENIVKNEKYVNKPVNLKTHRRTASENICLLPLQGKIQQKAPKIFKNQIFTDIYDEYGNHDRILETIESLEIYQENNEGKIIFFNNKSDITTEKLIHPDLSYKSIEITSEIFNEELFNKLQKIAEKSKLEIDELLKPYTIGRHKNNSQAVFCFPLADPIKSFFP